MATHTISDVLYGIIRFRREGITTGEFLLDQSITVANDDLINIVEDYTSDSGTASKTVFHGRVINVNYEKAQYIHAVDVADELDQVRPSGTYTGYTEVVLGEIITDASLANITCTKTESTMYLEPTGDVAVGSFDDPNGNNNNVLYDDIDSGAVPDDGNYIEAQSASTQCELSFPANGLSVDYNYIIYQIDIECRSRSDGDGIAKAKVRLYNGSTYEDWQNCGSNDETWVTDVLEFTGLTMTQDDVDAMQVDIQKTSLLDPPEIKVSNLRVKVYYRYYAGLKKGTVSATYNLDGNSSIKEILKTLSLVELYTWYYDPDLELHFDDGATVSGEALLVADKMRSVIGNRQVMGYDKVVLYGAYSGGSQITSTRGVGNIIWRDNYLNVTEQAVLDALADQILVEQGANTVKIQMTRVDSTDGIYQVGETISIGAINIIFENSSRVIPNSTTYIFNKIDYIISDGAYFILDLELIDGLLFTTPKDDTIGIVQDDTTNNAAGVAQVAGGESVGQANTGANIGTDGVGVYDSKSGVTLQFRNIAPASGKITVAENGDDIDIDVAEGQLSLANLGTKTHANLSDAPADAHHVAFVQADADALYSVLAHLHDDRYYTETEIDAMDVHAEAHVIGSHSDVTITGPAENDILQYDGYSDWVDRTLAEAGIAAVAALHDAVTVTAPITLVGQLINIENDVAAVITEIDTGVLSELDTTIPTSKTVWDAVATKDTKEEAHAYVEANALTMTQNITFNAGQTFDGEDVSALAADLANQCTTTEAAAKILADDDYIKNDANDETTGDLTVANLVTTGLVDGVDVSKLIEQSAAFPGGPSEGDFHYDEDDDSLYRYNAEALAWIEVGAGGGQAVAASIDNLGNHTATEDLDLGNFDIQNVVSINGQAAGYMDIYGQFGLDFHNTQNVIYLRSTSSAGIALFGSSTEDLYFKLSTNWNTVHADAFTEHSEALPIGISTDKILNIKNIDGKIDHKSLPSEAYYADKEGKEEGMKLGAMVMHLVKTIQELEPRIKELEGVL